MDYVEVVKKAWLVAWRNRAMWLFGLLAGFAGGGSSGLNYSSGSSGGGSGDSSGGSVNAPPWLKSPRLLLIEGMRFVELHLAVVAAMVVVLLALFLIGKLLRWVARPALVHMAAETGAGKKVTFGDGLSAGGSFLVRNVAMGWILWAPVFIISAVVLGSLGLIAYRGMMASNTWGEFVTPLIALGLSLLGFSVVIGLVTFPLRVFTTVCLQVLVVNDEPGPVAAITRCWREMRANIGQFAVVWLLSLVVAVAVGMMLLAGILLVGVVIAIVVVIGVLVQTQNAVAGIVVLGLAAIVGLIALVAVLVLSGFLGTFVSNYWTYSYQAVVARGRDEKAVPAGASA